MVNATNSTRQETVVTDVPVISLELSVQEAEVLMGILGTVRLGPEHVSGSRSHPAHALRAQVTPLWYALTKVVGKAGGDSRRYYDDIAKRGYLTLTSP